MVLKGETSSDVLWKCVMKYVVENHPECSGFWRLAVPNLSECSLCKEQGGGVLWKCAADKCKKEYHVDCAFHEGGLSLDEDGILKFQCETHFKPILFCSCRQSYDELRGYICCDICCEWFHYTCVGLKDNSKLENFNCTSCLIATRQGKDMAPVKEKNLAKELLSSSHQTAIKALGALVEISGSICPMIDQINSSPSDSQQHITGNTLPRKIVYPTVIQTLQHTILSLLLKADSAIMLCFDCIIFIG
jgi:hypothetical protein